VRVVRGSLEGVEGILVRKKNLFRLVLSVDMLAQSVAVEVHASDVEPCGDLSSDGGRDSSPIWTDKSSVLKTNSSHMVAP
jgi:hypothetical protein